MDATKNSPSDARSAIILHIATSNAWELARHRGFHGADSLSTEGFIHCSTPEQVLEVAHRLFRGREDLLLLVIDPSRLKSDLRFERAENGKVYPHIHGVIDIGAVVRTIGWPCRGDGTFELPELT